MVLPVIAFPRYRFQCLGQYLYCFFMLHFSLEIKLNHYPAFLETRIEILRLKKEKL